MQQARLHVEVDVQVDLDECVRDARLVEEGAQALVLLRREDDGRPFGARREARERPWLPDERLSFEPSEIDRLTRPLGAPDPQEGPHAPAVGALDGRKLELPPHLASPRPAPPEPGRPRPPTPRVRS